MQDQIIEAWEIHNRIQLFVLDSVPDTSLQLATCRRTRTAADHFAHMHNVRLMWIKAAAPDLMAGLEKVEKDSAADKTALKKAFAASGYAISRLLEQSIAAGGRVKGFKPNAVGFLGYLISHESYHQGKIDLILRLAGHPIDDKTHYGMWEWGSR